MVVGIGRKVEWMYFEMQSSTTIKRFLMDPEPESYGSKAPLPLSLSLSPYFIRLIGVVCLSGLHSQKYH